MFDVVATPEDIPSDQLLHNDILIPFAGNKTKTINGSIALRRVDKA